MSRINVEPILKQVEGLLASAGALSADAELAVEKLLNVVEALCSDRIELTDEVERLRKQLEKKKKPLSMPSKTSISRRSTTRIIPLTNGENKVPRDLADHATAVHLKI